MTFREEEHERQRDGKFARLDNTSPETQLPAPRGVLTEAPRTYKSGERPAVRVLDPSWIRPRPGVTPVTDGWELSRVNSKTAYVRHPFFVGELAFDAEHVVFDE